MDIYLRLKLGHGRLITICVSQNYPWTDLLHLLTTKDVNPSQTTNTTKNLTEFLKNILDTSFKNCFTALCSICKTEKASGAYI